MNPLVRRINALSRYGLVHLGAGPLGQIVINEYPKSGGTWLGQMLAQALDLPFPRNRFPRLGPAILHGHYLHPWNMRRTVVLWRDGRDVMVSWYHHCLVLEHPDNVQLLARTRADLALDDVTDLRANLPRFIEYAFTRQRHPRFSWAAFVRHWLDRPTACFVRYEDLRRAPAVELRRVAREIAGRRLTEEQAEAIAASFSFENQTGRKPGQEQSGAFLRKGIIGDWRNQFSRRAREVFDAHAGAELIALGYERDRVWVVRDEPPSGTSPTAAG